MVAVEAAEAAIAIDHLLPRTIPLHLHRRAMTPMLAVIVMIAATAVTIILVTTTTIVTTAINLRVVTTIIPSQREPKARQIFEAPSRPDRLRAISISVLISQTA